MVVSVYFLVRNYAALHDEEKLKKLYIELTDERNIEIKKESLNTSSTISMVVIALASIASGFFSAAISITLAAVLLVNAVITILVQLYYEKKM